MSFNFGSKELALIVIISGEFLAKQLPSICSGEPKYRPPHI